MGYKRTVVTVSGRRDSGSSFGPSLVRSTDDQILLNQIEETHVPDASRELEVRPLFLVVEHVIGRICHIVQSGAHEASWSELEAGVVISHDVTLLIERLSCEMGCKCLGGAKTHDVTVSILETLANYSWEAKLVIALAAFSVSYGEFLQLSQAYSTNPLGQSMKPLRHMRSLVAQSEAFKTQFATINKLVNVIVDVTRLVVELSEYPNEFRNQQEPLAIYWAIESTVAASTLINLFATHGDGYLPPRELEPSKFSNNINFVRYNLEKLKEHVMHNPDFSISGADNQPTLPSNPSTNDDEQNPNGKTTDHDTTQAESQIQTTLYQKNSQPTLPSNPSTDDDKQNPNGEASDHDTTPAQSQTQTRQGQKNSQPTLPSDPSTDDDKQNPNGKATDHAPAEIQTHTRQNRINSQPTLPSNPSTNDDKQNPNGKAIDHDTTPVDSQTQTRQDQKNAISGDHFSTVGSPGTQLGHYRSNLDLHGPVSKEESNGGSTDAQGDGVNGGAKEMRPFRFEVAEFVKEVLRPAWKKGQMSKEVYKAVVRKAVDNVYDSIRADHIPRTKERIDQYLSFSKPKLNKLVQEAYEEKIVEERTNTLEKREEESYQMIRKTAFDMVHPDNLAVLKALIYSKDDILPLYDGSQRKRVSLNELKGKTVLLLVTGLDIASNELKALKKIYMESKTHTYNIVWIPIVDTNDVQGQLKFDNALSTMPWHSVHHVSVVSYATIRFIKGDLNFKGKPILVALDDKGAIESMNAFNMMWIWKNDAFTMNSAKKEVLLKQQTWNLELLFNNNQRIMDWVKKSKYIVVYGGDDIDWIQNFKKTAKEVTTSAKINLELIYIGKASKNEKVKKIIAFMEAHKLGHYLKDETDMWFFWTRLDSILQSKIRMGEGDGNTDMVTQEVKKLVSYDTDVGAWAILAKGSEIVHSGEGTAFLEVFSKHEVWIREAHKKHQCQFESKKLSEEMRCPECKKTLNIKIIMSCL